IRRRISDSSHISYFLQNRRRQEGERSCRGWFSAILSDIPWDRPPLCSRLPLNLCRCFQMSPFAARRRSHFVGGEGGDGDGQDKERRRDSQRIHEQYPAFLGR